MQKLMGTLIGKYLSREYKKRLATPLKLKAEQEKIWKNMRGFLKGTDLYRDLNLQNIKTYTDYVKKIPVRDYDFYSKYITEILDGKSSVLFKDSHKFFGLTSGTSSKVNKKIPYNEGILKVFQKSQKLLAANVSSKKQFNLFTDARLSFGAAPETYSEKGFSFGYVSGILSSRMPRILARNSYPSKEILTISDWDEKIDRILEQTLNQDIKIITGVPTYLIHILETVLKKTGKKTLREIWPNLTTFIYGAIPVQQYKKRLNELAGIEFDFVGLYVATEAPIGITYTNDEYIFLPGVLLSFTPTEGKGECLCIDEIKAGNEYYVNTGTPNGFLSYTMKDIIKVVQTAPILTYTIIGRKGNGMNLSAEKVSEMDLLNVVTMIRTKYCVDIEHYMVSPSSRNGKPCYQWSLFTKSPEMMNVQEMIKLLDETLSGINEYYAYCRHDSVLEAPRLSVLPSFHLKDYFEANRDKGQFKMKTTFQKEDDYSLFIQELVRDF